MRRGEGTEGTGRRLVKTKKKRESKKRVNNEWVKGKEGKEKKKSEM